MDKPSRHLLVAPLLLAACAGSPDRQTLAELNDVEPDLAEVRVDHGLEQAMQGYRRFLEEAPESALTPEAMRRLADLKLEQVYGIHVEAESMPAPASSALPSRETGTASAPTPPEQGESDEEFERRAGDATLASLREAETPVLPDGRSDATGGPLEAIALYDEILATYPGYEHNDRVLYQKARALDELGRPDEAIAVIARGSTRARRCRARSRGSRRRPAPG